MNFADDIPLDIARAAHQGTSHVPEQRAEQERASYAETLASDHAALSQLADTEAKRAELIIEFERYRARYRTHFLAYLIAKSRCVSTMIAGPSNFDTRRHSKASDRSDRVTRELGEFRTRALAAIRKVLRPEDQPIMSGDANAAERLEDKIAKAEKRQALMKAANAAIKKNAGAGAEAQVAALVALGLPESIARGLLVPDFAQRIGFPGYELTNNASNIRRMKGRVAVVTEAKATPETVVEGTNARLEDAPPENRVRLFFPGKPSFEIREQMKARGFRWSPSLGCWQAYRNHYSLALARELAGQPVEAAS